MPEKKPVRKKFILLAAAVLSGFVILFFAIASLVLEPLLKKKLHALIIERSDSLYHYSLGSLNADVFGANVSVENLKMWVDSNRFRQRRSAGTLPPVTVGLDLKSGKIRGISLLALLAGNRIKIRRIESADGSLTLARHYSRRGDSASKGQPFWKAVQPSMDGISIGKIQLDNMKFAYWDLGPQDLQFQFGRLDAVLQDIKVDSAMLADTARLGYVGHLTLGLKDMAYHAADSVYKLNVGAINYTSDNRMLEVDRFHLQPSNTYDQLLRLDTVGKTYFSLQTGKLRFHNFRLEQFINANALRADSFVMQSPVVDVYFDRAAPKDMQSKVGNFPHQLLAKAPMDLTIKHLKLANLQLSYTEKSDRTGKQGEVRLTNVNIEGNNLTNEQQAIRANPVCTLQSSGQILGSPITARFRLYLDSDNGHFDAEGSTGKMTAARLNPLAESLAGIRINQLNIDEVAFAIEGNDSAGRGKVRMRYNGVDLAILKINSETGDVETKRFLTNLVNKYMVYPSNPGPGGKERVAENAKVDRLLWHSFFGLIWKTIFIGMQNILLKG